MNTVTILVLTIWITLGGEHGITARSIVAPDYASCKHDGPAIQAQLRKQGIPIGNEKATVDAISGICLQFDKPKKV